MENIEALLPLVIDALARLDRTELALLRIERKVDRLSDRDAALFTAIDSALPNAATVFTANNVLELSSLEPLLAEAIAGRSARQLGKLFAKRRDRMERVGVLEGEIVWRRKV